MTGSREESVTFSLKELQDLEDDRLKREARDREDAENARVQAETRAREEREAKALAAAQEEERRRHRELDELAQKEAMQKAVVEQARVEVEVRARADERERERRHEIELARLRKAPAETRASAFVGTAFAGAAIALVVCMGTYFGVVKPSSDKRIAELERAVAAADQRGDTLAKRGEEQRQIIAELQARPSTTTTAPTTTTSTARPPTTPRLPPRNNVKIGGNAPSDCPAGDKDPMCFAPPK